jgi:hypothetical protein
MVLAGIQALKSTPKLLELKVHEKVKGEELEKRKARNCKSQEIQARSWTRI